MRRRILILRKNGLLRWEVSRIMGLLEMIGL